MDQAVVVGAGALGLYFAGLIVKKLKDEGLTPPGDAAEAGTGAPHVDATGGANFDGSGMTGPVGPRPVHLVVRTKVRFPVRFAGELAQTEGVPLALERSDVETTAVQNLGPLQPFPGAPQGRAFSGVLFLCVPADATAKAVEDVCAWLGAMRTGRVTLVLCSNGLIPNGARQDIARLVEKRPEIFPVRALVYAGFERLFPETAYCGTEVIHNGGRRIDYGPLLGPGDGARTADWSDSDRRTWNEALRALTPGLEWSYVPDIGKQEFVKFFVNLTIAAHTGPRRMTNSQLAELLPRERSREIAAVYASLRPDLQADARELDDTLWSTVRATGSNVNSISLAGFQGRPQLFWFFVSQLNDNLRKCPSADVQEFFKKYLRAAGKLWAQEI